MQKGFQDLQPIHPLLHGQCFSHRVAHIIMDFQTLGYIPLSCFLQSKLFLAGLMLVGPNMICHNVSPGNSPSSFPCHSQAFVWKFSHPLTRTNRFRFTGAFSTSSSLSFWWRVTMHLKFSRKLRGSWRL